MQINGLPFSLSIVAALFAAARESLIYSGRPRWHSGLRSATMLA